MSEAAFEDELLQDAPARADIDPDFVAELVEAIANGDADLVRRLLTPLHEADIADVIEQLSASKQEALAELAPDIFTGEVISELAPDTREAIMAQIGAVHLAAAITELDSDDATDVLEELDEEFREAVLAEVPEADREAMEQSQDVLASRQPASSGAAAPGTA